MRSRPSAKLESDREQRPATGFREAMVMLRGRVGLPAANRACRALESLRPGSESHVTAQLERGVRVYFRYPGRQIAAAEMEAAAAGAL